MKFKVLKHKISPNTYGSIENLGDGYDVLETTIPQLFGEITTIQTLENYWSGLVDKSDFDKYELVEVEIKTLNPDHIYAPFTEEQVKNLNEYQASGQLHPFTCGGTYCGDRSKHEGGLLEATRSGWICPCKQYSQNWAHKFMAEVDTALTLKNNSDVRS
jgi:hypothetical protein